MNVCWRFHQRQSSLCSCGLILHDFAEPHVLRQYCMLFRSAASNCAEDARPSFGSNGPCWSNGRSNGRSVGRIHGRRRRRNARAAMAAGMEIFFRG